MQPWLRSLIFPICRWLAGQGGAIVQLLRQIQATIGEAQGTTGEMQGAIQEMLGDIRDIRGEQVILVTFGLFSKYFQTGFEQRRSPWAPTLQISTGSRSCLSSLASIKEVARGGDGWVHR